MVLCTPFHSYTRKGGILGDREGGFCGAGRGVAIYEKPETKAKSGNLNLFLRILPFFP